MLSPVSDSIEEEIGEEIGLSMSIPAPKGKGKSPKTRAAHESDTISMEIEGFESSKKQSKAQNSRYTNSMITESNIVSDF